MIVNPSEWFQNEEIKLKALQELDQSAFVAHLRGLVQESPRRSLWVVVHGFREAFPSALRKTANRRSHEAHRPYPQTSAALS